ncbi:hypothetical protein GCM10010507_49730 [Streptomyces cinnamoneus]|uniref:Uncharacterized protein n=1 Tax=Streptomyces cinnamoneus TaxID=53446 RepID=A0A918U1I2_STRCJ|nr:hypothetical protein GCM10010507_49730 [Streptomyces cinnamoneus]
MRMYGLDGDGTAAGAPPQVHPAHATRTESAQQPVRAYDLRIFLRQGLHRAFRLPLEGGLPAPNSSL